MKLVIERFKEIPDGTLGTFELINGNRSLMSGYTLEPIGEDTIERGMDMRIPQGRYLVAWHKSPRFSRTLPLLYNKEVPKDRYILIHAGNFPKDTEGCILVGNKYDDKGVYNSLSTLNALLNYVRGMTFTVEIRNNI